MKRERPLLSQLKNDTCIYLLRRGMEALVPGRPRQRCWAASLSAPLPAAPLREGRRGSSKQHSERSSLGPGKASTLICDQRLNKALHSSLEIIRFLSVPKFYRICN